MTKIAKFYKNTEFSFFSYFVPPAMIVILLVVWAGGVDGHSSNHPHHQKTGLEPSSLASTLIGQQLRPISVEAGLSEAQTLSSDGGG